MIKTKKKRWGLLAAGIAVVAVLWLFPLGTTEEETTRFVLTNLAQLEEIATAHLNGDETTRAFGAAEVDGIYTGEHCIVQFLYDGRGFGPSTAYYGFYYSPEDLPACYQNAPLKLAVAEDGSWTWSDGTDNGGLTKRITENWFYYEAWF